MLLLISMRALLAEDPNALNEYVAEIRGGEENARIIVESIGFRFVRKVCVCFF